MVNLVSWKQVGLDKEPGGYMLRFDCVTTTAQDLALWEKYDAGFFR